MTISLPLDEMTVEEKLQLMEAIWDDLSRHADEMEPPAWHGKVLKELEAAIERGDETFEDWETAKRRIRDSLA
ncbi:MAG: addiction module protein [Achromobacter sp.]|nr:addiction module protein [Achromobacter sp.]